jgi:hypothetical protein
MKQILSHNFNDTNEKEKGMKPSETSRQTEAKRRRNSFSGKSATMHIFLLCIDFRVFSGVFYFIVTILFLFYLYFILTSYSDKSHD